MVLGQTVNCNLVVSQQSIVYTVRATVNPIYADYTVHIFFYKHNAESISVVEMIAHVLLDLISHFNNCTPLPIPATNFFIKIP